MIGKSKLLDLLTQALKWSNADQTLISCYSVLDRVTRFHNFRIHQDIEESDISIYFKVDINGRLGVASTNSLAPKDLKGALKEAIKIARVSPKPKVKFKFPSGEPAPSVVTYYPGTINFSFEQRIHTLKHIFADTKERGLQLAGSFLTGEEEVAVVNSYKDTKYQTSTIAALKLIAMDGSTSLTIHPERSRRMDGPASGFSSAISRDVTAINWDIVLSEAIKRCLEGRNPQPIKLGRYECLLEPEAVGDILQWLGYIGFGAKQFYEKTSFLSGRIGERLMSCGITIFDEGLNPQTLIYPFDFEGTPKKKVTLIEDGIAKGVVYDSHYGSIYKKGSTGHALLPDEVEGPLPLNLIMEPGDSSIEDMRASIKRGVSVTRFHYINGLLKPKEALMTGLTRDGTFLIEGGKIKKSLKNLRFTDSILRAFSNIRAVSMERKLVGDPAQEMGSSYVPALLIKDFAFTGITE